MCSARLTLTGEGEVAGRQDFLLGANPGRDDSRWWGLGETPFDVAIDMDRGVVLRGPHFEVSSIEFDAALPDEAFCVPQPSPGATFVRPSEPPRRMALAEARSAAPFPIRLPSSLPGGARLEDEAPGGKVSPVALPG